MNNSIARLIIHEPQNIFTNYYEKVFVDSKNDN